jgi:tRNA pseudouridine38-40 synthase
MRRYKLTFEYDGTGFLGWQRQPEGRTVEGVIESALATLYQQEIDLIGQGRTDAGVHASGQTAHADLPQKYDPGRVMHAMKGLLPGDVSLIGMEPVPEKFHARFDAKEREYRYCLMTRRSPLNRHYCWSHYKTPDLAVLQSAAGRVEGSHDFTNFCIPGDHGYGTTLCTIARSQWEQEGDRLFYTIRGNRFLRHMVRRLVGSMVQLATGEMTESDFDRMLQPDEMKQKGYSAPAKGLVLMKVVY